MTLMNKKAFDHFDLVKNNTSIFNPLTYSHYIETYQLICTVNQLTGFYLMETLVIKGVTSGEASFSR